VQIAQEKGMLDKVKSDMEGILALSKDSRDFVVMLQSPVVSHDKKKTILKQIFSGKIETLSMNFIELLTRKARENGLIDIATAFLRIYQEVNGIQPARIVSAIPLSAAAREEVSSS
jgi:F-type H+-transporting ATPase subunit delta